MRLILAGMLALLSWLPLSARAQTQPQLTIAAAANLHYAMDQVLADYRQAHPQARIEAIYGASGKLTVQIQQHAPFDLFFAADSDYPRQLVDSGDAAGAPVLYAVGQLVMWSASVDLAGLGLKDLLQPRFARIAIGNPLHAPYGRSAEQALRAAGVWEALQPRLVYGADIGQAAQFARTGNAQVGLIAESLALDPSMGKGSFVAVPPSLYAPLRQSFVVTRHGADNPLAQDFARYVQGPQARAILARYGFKLPAARP